MKNLLKIEELFLFGLSLFLVSGLGYGWDWYALSFFAPDLTLGYLANPHIGAQMYNFIHHKGLAVAVYVLGYLLSVPWLMFARTILLGHSSLGRVFGYGLKYPRRVPEYTFGQDYKMGPEYLNSKLGLLLSRQNADNHVERTCPVQLIGG